MENNGHTGKENTFHIKIQNIYNKQNIIHNI